MTHRRRTQQQETLIRGGTIVTMDGSRRVLDGDVLVVGKRIAAVGRVPAASGRRIIDARGCAVIPGLVQAHVHLCQTLFRGMADDLPLLAWLQKRIWPLEAAHDEDSLRLSAELGVAEVLLAGTTALLDMGTTHGHDAVFEVLRASGIRALSGKAMMDRGTGVPRRLRESTRESLRESARLCAAWHGAEQGRLRYAFAPRFVLSCTEPLLRDAACLAEQSDALVHSHVAEHAAERAVVRRELGMSDIRALERANICGPRAVLAHGVQLTGAELRSLGRKGTRLVHCPSANLKLASGIADVRAMRAAGIVVGLGADGAPCNNRLDPWTELRLTALLAKVKTANAAALCAREAFELLTRDGARVLGLERQIGSIEVGKCADLAVVRLDRAHNAPPTDIYGRLVYGCVAADVDHVFVDGQPLVEHRELTTLDADRIVARATATASSIRVRAGV